jgi:hypothetical protein
MSSTSVSPLVSPRPSYVPAHRSDLPAPSRPSRFRRILTRSAAAVAATGLAISSCLVLSAGSSGEQASAAPSVTPPLALTAKPDAARAALLDRAPALSRSVRRTPVDATKARALSQRSGGQVTRVANLSTGDPRTIARALLAKYGFGQDQFTCLDSLYAGESGWDVHADNPSSSAYGIPQALPGEKMSSAGSDWANNPATQIKWGLGYIKGRYGTPCDAWGFKQGHGWY